MDSPEDVVAEPLPSGLRVTWKIEQKEWIIPEETECEIQLHEKGSYKVHVKVSLSTKSCMINICVPCVVYKCMLIHIFKVVSRY